MSFGNNPITGTQSALPDNQFPLSSVAVPGAASGNLTALEGGPASTDSNGNSTAPVSIYAKDGSNVTQGTTTDAAVTTDIAATISAKLRGMVKISGDIWDSTNHRMRVDGSGVTQPISAASLPLPSGAATSAKQPALGTAGTASSDVLTVQGIASMTALKTDGSAVTQPVSGTVAVSNFPGTQAVSGTVTANIGTTNGLALDTSVNGVLVSQGSATSGEKGPLVQGAVTTSSPSYTTAQTSPISLTTAGAVRVDGSATTQPVSGTFWQATQPVSGAITANAGTNLNTSALALDSSINGVLVSQGSTTSGEKGPLIQGAVTTNAPSYTTAQTSPVSLDTSGLLRTSLKDTPSNTNNLNVNLAASAATVTVSATNLQTNLNQIAGSAIGTAATGIMKVGVTDGSGTAITSTGAALDVNVKSGSGGFSAVDEAAWTAGSSNVEPIGGVFNDSAAALTSGQQGTARLTNNRAIHVNLRDASANQLLGSKTSANSVPVVVASDQGAIPASQSGTWTVQPGNTANTTPWLQTQYYAGCPSYIFKEVKQVTVTAGTGLSVWTPANGKKFRLMGFCLYPGGTGTYAILLLDTVVYNASNEFVRVPHLGSANTVPTQHRFEPYGYLSTAANNQLWVDVTTTGTVDGYVYGFEE